MREKSDQLKEIVSLEDRQIREYEHTAREYKRESEAIVRQAEQRRKSAMDEVAKANREVKRLGESSDKDLLDLKASVDDLKKGLGGIAGLNDNMFTLKKDLAEITAQKNALLKELSEMEQNIKAVNAIKKPAEKSAKAEGLKDQATSIAEKVSNLKQSTEKMGEDFNVLGTDKKKEEEAGSNK